MTPFTPDMPPTNVNVTGDLLPDPDPDPEDEDEDEDEGDDDEQAAATRTSSPPAAILIRCVVLIDCYLPFC
jgi:hypothetical protein